jgi:hypothetical protein
VTAVDTPRADSGWGSGSIASRVGSLVRPVRDVSRVALHPAREPNVPMTSANGVDHPSPRHRINRSGDFGYRA